MRGVNFAYWHKELTAKYCGEWEDAARQQIGVGDK